MLSSPVSKAGAVQRNTSLFQLKKGKEYAEGAEYALEYARTGSHAVKCGICSGANSSVTQRISAAAYGILSGAKTYHHRSHHLYTHTHTLIRVQRGTSPLL